MRIVDANWELRNLGVTTQEVLIEENDMLEDIQIALDKLDAEYLVIKVPVGKIDVMWKLEDEGFHYIETNIHVVHNLDKMGLTPLLSRIDNEILYYPMDENDIIKMKEEIKKGLFYTDRIALDKHFTLEQSASRYIGWIEDEYKRGTELFKYVYRGKDVGFFSFKDLGEGVYYPFLAGIYKDFQKSPLGLVYLYKPLLEARARNGKMISTYISLNNSNATRMHVQFGFEFKEMTNVYIKHVDNRMG